MTIDERLEKLTDRHEALAQSVEVLAVQVEQSRKNIDTLALSIRDLVGVVRSHESRIVGLEGN